MSQDDNRTKTLVIEFELPSYYAEDMAGEDWAEWLREVGADTPKAVGDEILRNIGEVYSGLLTIEPTGEKDSEIVRIPVIARGARIENREPSPEGQYKAGTDRLAERVDEPHDEERVLGAMYRAEARVYGRMLRTFASEYAGQVAELARQALQEARHESDEAQARESERGSVFG